MPAATSGDTFGLSEHPEGAANPPGHLPSQWWHEKWDDIVHSGYKLGPRCSSRWPLPWLKSDRGVLDDQTQSEIIMDAVRMRDGLPVILKRVPSVESPHELMVNQFFSSQELAGRPDNHCVPMLDVVELQHFGCQQLMVFPHLLPFRRSQIRTFEEFVVFITQVCEGIQFMHQRDVAYGNCTASHIMFDPSGISLDDWFNPSQIDQNYLGRIKRWFTRTQRHPRYYLSDLGWSRKCTPLDAPDPSLRIDDMSILERRVDRRGYPFCMDIYCLGNLVRENFVQKYQGFEFVQDLVDTMTNADPERRPTIEQVVESLALALRPLSKIHLRSTFVLRDPGLTRTARLFHTLLYNLQRRSSMAVP